MTNIDQTEAEQGKVLAIIGYISFLFLVPLLGAKDNRFAQYHANQGLLLFIVEVAGGILGLIPLIGWLIRSVVGIFSLVLMVIGILNAAKLEARPLPVIGGVTLIQSY